MPEADAFQAPDGGTFHGELLESVTEAFVGNGVLANGDGDVTADSGTAMGIDVAAGDIAFKGATYAPTAASFTLSDGPTTTTNSQDDRRVDLVYFDEGTAAYDVLEGTAAPNPSPPATPADGLLLALVLVPHEATNIQDGDILNWRARPAGGQKTSSDETRFEEGLHVGFDPAETITETTSPKSFTYTAGDRRDVHLQTDVTISNSSGASATEDITVELYDGTDTTGTLLQSETKSISLADGASTTSTFITTDETLDGGDYHINITQSGTDLTVDQTDESTKGLEWSTAEADDGTLQLINRYTGTTVLSVDPLTDEPTLPNGAIDTAELASAAVTTAKIASGAVTAAEIATDTVTATEIATGGVTTTEISDGTIAAADISSGAVTDTEVYMPSVVVEDPERQFIARLDDTESIEIPVRVPDTQTLEVYRWGAFDASDGTAPAGLTVELLDGADTVQVSANTANNQSKSTPVASHSNSSGSASIFKIRAKNGTGAGINTPGVGMVAGFVVV